MSERRPPPPALTDPRRILREYGIRPRKGLAQHFLADRVALGRIVQAADLKGDDVVLEIGPGLGVLTRALAAAAGRVVAVEIDPAMRAILSDTTGDCPNVAIVAGDILKLEPPAAAGVAMAPAGRRRGYKVVANLPYSITSAVLRRVLGATVRPELAVLTVQKEVADRVLAGPGDMSVLAVSVQLYAEPRRVAAVPARAFYPPPKVDSAVLRLDVYERPPVDLPGGDEAGFFRIVRAGFGQKRKQLKNSLSAGLGCPVSPVLDAMRTAGIDPTRRAETLSLAEWARLASALRANERPGDQPADYSTGR